jgi:hypothetical protein
VRCESGERKTKAVGWRDVGAQRLDRDYGIALLRKRMYSVIAAVLAAYWARSRPLCPSLLRVRARSGAGVEDGA